MIWIPVVALALVLGVFILQYNKLIGMRQLVRNGWADVDVYLKRRADLVPQIAEAVRGYASHERALLEAVATARNQAIASGSNLALRAPAESDLTTGLARIVMLKEAYPELKASENFLGLQNDLRETEKLIASARQYYNACVRDLNTAIEAFPSNLVAGVAGVRPQEFFELDDAVEREAPKV
ncbi:MAG: LemA family protein [Fimbriimonadaceae bacterium]|nr:LemA family protein [Fimbriimonadaceae bacterium]